MIDNLVFERQPNGECKISPSEFLRMLTENYHGYGYYHLTTWSRLCGMLEPVTVPGDEKKHRMLHLGAAANMNDISDKRSGKGVYFTCFSFGPSENISMWTNYGIPNEDAVRIKCTRTSVLKWVEIFRNGKIGVYGVESDGSLTPITTKAEVKLVDVAYWSKKDVGKNKHDPNEGLFIYRLDKYRLEGCKDIKRFMENQPWLFKEIGWSYEKETRLVLVFDEDLADRYQRVAVPFDRPFEWLLDHFSEHVMRGPWFDEKKMPKSKAAGHSLSEARPSRYHGLVRMRSVCDTCPEQNKKECKCPYKGQR